MVRYAEKVLLPFTKKKREAMGLEHTHPYVAIFDVFRDQQTPSFLELLENNNINHINVPANCADKLQSLDISVNKPPKDEMKQHFHSWYADEVQKQLESGVAIQDVKINSRTSTLKPKSANWLMGSLASLLQKPRIILKGFRKTGFLDTLKISGQ